MAKRTSLVLGAALSVALFASAYTVEDLVVDNGYYVIENLYWSRADQMPNRYQPAAYQYPEPVIGLSKCMEFNYVKDASGNVVPYYVKAKGLTVFSGATKLTKNWNFKFANSSDITDIETDAQGIYLPNDQYVPSNRNIFTYSGGCSDDGSSLIQAMHGYTDDEIIESFYNAGIGQVSTFYILYNYYNGRPQRPYLDTWAGEITPTSDGYRIDFGSAIYWPRSTAGYTLLSSNMMSYINSTEENIIHRMELEVFKPTGFFDCKEYAYNAGSSSYSTTGVDLHIPLRVKTYSDGTFTILNLMNNGYSRVLDDYLRVDKDLIRGRFDSETGKVYLYGGQGVDVPCSRLGTSGDNNAHYLDIPLNLANLTAFPSTQFNYDNIEGQLTEGAIIEHRTSSNFWVTPGRCRTYITNAKAQFGPFTAINNQGSNSMSAYVGELSLGELDVTLNADITGGELGYSADELWPRISFSVKGNDTYVESYTLYMVPLSKIGSTSTDHSHYSAENGHTYGYAVATLDAATVTGAYPKEYYFSHRFKKSEMPADCVDPSDDYVFYVSANYRSNIEVSPVQAPARESVQSRASNSLESTYHGLFTPNKTGVEVVAEDNILTVVAGQGTINVSGTESTVTIHTADGRQVYVGKAGCIDVPAGFYIVRAGGKSTKVLVR